MPKPSLTIAACLSLPHLAQISQRRSSTAFGSLRWRLPQFFQPSLCRARCKKTKRRQTCAGGSKATCEMVDVREAITKQFFSTLKGHSATASDRDAQSVAASLEQALFDKNGCDTANTYRQAARSHLSGLKANGALCEDLLHGRLTAMDFAAMSSLDMSSCERRRKDDELKRIELENTMRATLDINTINEQKSLDGRTREKWGVEGSHAAVDEF